MTIFYFDNFYNNYILIIFFYYKNVDVFVSTCYIQRKYYGCIVASLLCVLKFLCFFFLNGAI